ncbi:MAG: ABC transporter permease [Eubacteriales bacterium]|jgi:tungstate transport system permease protein|nr:ABC transporter permease [Eubacteriales bacterium]
MGSAFARALDLLFAGNALLVSIITVTLKMTLLSSCAALLLGAPYGVLLASARFPGRRALILINRTLTGLPPVVCGLICYLLFSGTGPLRGHKLLFTVAGMVIAQVLLITPIVASSMETAVSPMVYGIRESARGLGLTRGKTFLLTLNESRYALVSSYLLGFGRAMAEVGAVSMVGGAIAYKTNVMTTAIMMYTNMGNFSYALALGILLLLISLVVNVLAHLLQRSVGI